MRLTQAYKQSRACIRFFFSQFDVAQAINANQGLIMLTKEEADTELLRT